MIVICLMTPCARVWCVVVITIVAGDALIRDQCMCTVQWIVVIMIGEYCGHPLRLRMTRCTVIGKLKCRMGWVVCLVIIGLMASHASIWGIVIVSVMTRHALIGYKGMGAG